MKKVSFKVALLVGTVEIITMAVLFLLINRSVTQVLTDKVMKDMDIAAKDRAEIVDTYMICAAVMYPDTASCPK